MKIAQLAPGDGEIGSDGKDAPIGDDALDHAVLLDLGAGHGQHRRHGARGFVERARQMLRGFLPLPFLERDQAEKIGKRRGFRALAFQGTGKLAGGLESPGIEMSKGLGEGLLDRQLLLHGAVK